MLLVLALASGAAALRVGVAPVVLNPNMMPSRSPAPACGLFDGLLGGDPEAKARREAEKEEQFRAQQEMMARRRDPKKMEAYFQEVPRHPAALRHRCEPCTSTCHAS